MAAEMLEQLAQLEERTARAEALASALEEQVISLEQERASILSTAASKAPVPSTLPPSATLASGSSSIQQLLEMLAKLRLQLVAAPAGESPAADASQTKVRTAARLLLRMLIGVSLVVL
jgi:hypothetical protein